MSDQPYCRACTHFNETNGEKRCWHPDAFSFDRIDGDIQPIIDWKVHQICDSRHRFEPKGQS